MTTTDPTPASMGGPLSEADAATARIRAYLDACTDANSFGREIRWELRDADGHPYNLPRADLVAVLDALGVLEGQLATAREALAENVAEYDREIASFTLPTTMSREDEEGRDITRAEAKEARRCLEAFDDAVAAPEMPRPPAEESTVPTPSIHAQSDEQPADDSTEGATE